MSPTTKLPMGSEAICRHTAERGLETHLNLSRSSLQEVQLTLDKSRRSISSPRSSGELLEVPALSSPDTPVPTGPSSVEFR